MTKDAASKERVDHLLTKYQAGYPQNLWFIAQIGLDLGLNGKFACFFYHLLGFFKINLKKNLSGMHSECQMIWIQIRTDIWK